MIVFLIVLLNTNESQVRTCDLLFGDYQAIQ